MANTIALAKNYSALLDEVYKNASLTVDLMSGADMVREGANAHEIMIPKMTMDGQANYSRNDGYVKGDVTLEWETKAFNYDRGRLFVVDSMDDDETIGVAFGKLGAEYLRTKVVPETDAFTFATLCGKVTPVSGAITSGADAMTALETAITTMDNAEVSEGRILYITPNLYNAILNLNTNASRELLATFAKIVKVPQSRFYSAIKLNDGKTSGEEAGGYTKATGAKNINFMIVEPSAVIKFPKRVAGNVISPENNQTSDGYIQKFREYEIVEALDNKLAGIYAHVSTT